MNSHIICKTLAVLRNRWKNYTPYAFGLKYCSSCDEYFKQPENRCFCCNRLLRLRSTAKSGKILLKNTLKIMKKNPNNYSFKPKYILGCKDFELAQDVIIKKKKEEKIYSNIKRSEYVKEKNRRYKESLEYKIIKFFSRVSIIYTEYRNGQKSRKQYRENNGLPYTYYMVGRI